MKIFWSWQSDTPGKTGRFLIRDALKNAIEELKESTDIEEPVREAVHLDQDIQDVTGSPDLARTIFDKIELSEVVIADVTLVGQVFATATADKKLINSNVALELGYALHARTDRNVLVVFNEHYGAHEDLPFDLRHKGGAIVFNLRPEAERMEVEAQKKSLRTQFVRALKPFLLQKTGQAAAPFEETQSTFNRAAYFEIGETLLPPDLAYRDQCLSYLRVIPTKAIASIQLATLKEVVLDAPLLRDSDYRSLHHGVNQHGAIKCAMTPSKLTASTQLFENGEIWCVSRTLIRTERGPFVPEYWILPSLSLFVLEQTYYDRMLDVIAFAKKRLGLEPPLNVEMGLAGLRGLYLNWGRDLESGQRGPNHKSEITLRALLRISDADAISGLLLSFFSKVFDSVGERRPPNLHGFPPNRPSI